MARDDDRKSSLESHVCGYALGDRRRERALSMTTKCVVTEPRQASKRETQQTTLSPKRLLRASARNRALVQIEKELYTWREGNAQQSTNKYMQIDWDILHHRDHGHSRPRSGCSRALFDW